MLVTQYQIISKLKLIVFYGFALSNRVDREMNDGPDESKHANLARNSTAFISIEVKERERGRTFREALIPISCGIFHSIERRRPHRPFSLLRHPGRIINWSVGFLATQQNKSFPHLSVIKSFSDKAKEI